MKPSHSAKELRRYLNDSGTTQAQLGEQVGVKQSTVSKWLAGVATPSFATSIKIERLTGIEVASWGGPLSEYLRGKGAV